jgi:hypothetical protein
LGDCGFANEDLLWFEDLTADLLTIADWSLDAGSISQKVAAGLRAHFEISGHPITNQIDIPQ